MTQIKKPERAAKTRTGWMLLGIIGALVIGVFTYLYSEAESKSRAGDALVLEGKLAQAEAAYTQALQRFPFKGAYYASMARVREASGDDEAAAGFRKKARFFGVK